MIITQQCDLCGWLNDNNNGPCHKCGGQTEQRLVKGRYVTVLVKEPARPMRGFYNPEVRRVK